MSNISSASSFTRKLKAAEEAEAAKVALRYHDLEKQQRAEFEEIKEALERLEIMKKLDTAEAKLKAIEKVEIQDANSYTVIDKISVPDDSLDNTTKVNTYLNSTIPPVLTPQTVISSENRQHNYTSTPDPPERNLNLSHIPQPSSLEYKPTVETSSSYTRPQCTNISNPDISRNSVTLDTGDLCKLIVEQANLNRLPPPEPTVFSGTALEYPAWKASFQTLIENKNILPEQRMYYLQKYLSGSAKACVENFFLFNTEGAYNDAKALLEERYGNQFTIACSLRQKLKDTSKIGNRDSKALRNYADVLRQCESAMSSIPSLNILNDSLEIEELLEKLPDWLFNRWSRISYDSQKQKQRYPSFCEFVKFVTKEADILCDPVSMIRNSKRDSKSHSDSSYKHNNYSVKKSFNKGNNSVSFQTETTADTTVVLCTYCNKPHHISDCSEMKQKPLEDRKSYFFKNNLCFGCLNVGHKSQNCQKRLTCKDCSKPHPSLLHGDFKQKPNTVPKSVTSHTSYSKTHTVKSKSSMIVPVYLSHDDDPHNELLLYALEDTQSDSTFILSKSANDLNLNGTTVNLSLSTMTASNINIESTRYTGLSVRGINSKVRMPLPPVYSRDIMPANRSHIPVPSMVDKWPHLQKIKDKLHPLLDCDVGLLIGYDCPKLLAPINVIPPVNDSPFAQETVLGWGIIGILDCETVPTDIIGVSHRIMTSSIQENNLYVSCPTKVKEIIDPKHVLQMFELDFSEHSASKESFSSDDKLFLEKMSKGIHSSFDNHYEMPLPFKGPDPVFPNNKTYAVNRMRQLEHRLRKDYSLYKDYVSFMNDIIDHGYAELVPTCELSEPSSINSWYIPHHSVYHAKKPGKIRVVFDCNARYNNSSLNDYLLKGPDLTNTLLGVLCRFRKEPIAFTCDIEKMFYQFKVNESHRNYLRFLWWENNNIDSKLIDYRMTVHLFGAGSSPGCANFGLKQAANDYEELFGVNVSNFIRDNFYVDDGLKSVNTELEAINLIRSSKELLSKCGINLHKFISNSPEVLNSIPVNDRAQGIRNLDLCVEQLPIERVLGVHWHVDLDKFNFHITLKDKPLTRRGILSTISSIYDPLGFIAPFILIGKKILQELCRENIDWDGALPDRLRPEWERWRNEIIKLESVELDRCLKPKDFGDVRNIELHHFSDASSTGYGQCSYIRLVNDNNLVHCALLVGKSRVIPLRAITIPRLELSAAVVSVRISQFLEKELHYENVKHVFWTDSTVVMGYIRNDVRRFQIFVANRIQTIRDFSDPEQWNYVKSKQNPADIASRGAFVDELIQSNWFSGPDFIWSNNPIQSDNNVYELSVNDPEIKKTVSFAVQQTMPLFELDRLDRFSSWYKLKRAIANCIRFKNILRNKVLARTDPNIAKDNVIKSVSVSDLNTAEAEIIKRVQYEVFKTEIDYLTKNKNSVVPPKRFLKKSSSLFRLDPFLNSDGLLCVGGRLRSNDLGLSEKHPVILPRKHHITSLIIRHFHILSEHQGRGITTNILRSNGYWIIKCTSAVYEYINKCVNCRKYRGKLQEQKMANIPDERLQPSAPFSVCGVDCFGPFIVKEGRKELKRYGLLFTCMCSRAVHIETLHSMSTDSFINGLRRFIAIRGSICSLYCDNGSNFVGASGELFDKLKNLDQGSIREYLLRNNCDYFEFKFNVPHASHMGGIWERQIRSVRNVLISLLSQCGTQLDDETLNTFMFEAAAIVNSRPLSVDNLNDPNSLNPITPNHLLTMKSNIVLPPPGDFVKQDLYSRKRWRRVQYLLNVFWSRWKYEYLQTLQFRQKWNKPVRNVQIGDIVLLSDGNVSRNQWNLCRVVETFVGTDNLVRRVKLVVGNKNLNSKGQALDKITYLDRPVHKLVLVVESEN